MNKKKTIQLPGVLLDELKLKEDARTFTNGKRSGSRRESRREKRQLKKQKRFSAKPQSEIVSNGAMKKGTAGKKKAKKSVNFDTSTNEIHVVDRIYKKSDFHEVRFPNEEDSDEEMDEEFDEEYGEDSDDDFDGDYGSDESEPQTPQEVYEALKKAKSGIPKENSKPKKKSSATTKEKLKPVPKTAKEIMESLNGTQQSDTDSDFEFSSDSDLSDLDGPDQPQTAEEVFAALKRAKSGKMGTEKKENNVKEKKEKEKKKTAREIMEELQGKEDSSNSETDFSGDSDEISDLEGPDQPQTAEEVFAALKKAKEGKNGKNKKEKKEKKEKNDITEKKEKEITPEFLNDDDDIKYYAKKLGLKSMRLEKEGDDDIVGGLFEGLDFMSQYEDGNLDEETDDGDEKMSDGNDITSNRYDNDNVDDDNDTIPAKENPYVAPVAHEEKPTQKYISPAMRARLSEQNEDTVKLQRSIKGQLNKLSEANILVIANEINNLYLDNPRGTVNEILTKVLLSGIHIDNKLLDSFVVLYAAMVACIYKLQGSDFLVVFVQALIESYEKFYTANREDNQKQSSNLLSLLTYCYTLQVVGSKLIYDVIKELIKGVTEQDSELLLRLVQNCGSQLRIDDPTALKEIIAMIHSELKGQKLSPRMEFLLESIEDLKNNKVKKSEARERNFQLVVKMKKFLGRIGKQVDALAIGLDDVRNADKRGKWWLTGAAWKDVSGEDETKSEQNKVVADKGQDADDGIINYIEMAKAYRMNNDVRRAIFISIMSSEDYVDAFTKLDKLQLKRNQQKEIPNIILHCQRLEPTFNKFYVLLAEKLCSEHRHRKTLQFSLWTILREMNDESDDESDEENTFRSLNNSADDNEDMKLQKLTNSARFFGLLMAAGALQLNLLRIVNFAALSEDSRLFLEILFVTFIADLCKQKKKQLKDILEERMSKISDDLLVQGIQLFVKKTVKGSSFIKKKYKKGVERGVELICERSKKDFDD